MRKLWYRINFNWTRKYCSNKYLNFELTTKERNIHAWVSYGTCNRKSIPRVAEPNFAGSSPLSAFKITNTLIQVLSTWKFSLWIDLLYGVLTHCKRLLKRVSNNGKDMLHNFQEQKIKWWNKIRSSTPALIELLVLSSHNFRNHHEKQMQAKHTPYLECINY